MSTAGKIIRKGKRKRNVKEKGRKRNEKGKQGVK
jgi:hypothetical protein